MSNFIIYFIIAIAVLVVVFLILREVNCWYWKINERITLQQETNSLLKFIFSKVSNGSDIVFVSDKDENLNKNSPEAIAIPENLREPVLIQDKLKGERRYISKHEWEEMKNSGLDQFYFVVG